MAQSKSLSLLDPACLGRNPTSSNNRKRGLRNRLTTLKKTSTKSHKYNPDDMHNFKLPKVKSSVGNPEAARAAITAEGPGMGTTTIFSSTHSFTYGQ